MNTYTCLYKGKSVEVKSDTLYRAQVEGARILKARKTWDVITMLTEKADAPGVPVVHVAVD